MSEVQRFWSHEASNIRCVREADFDRVTAERDASLLELSEIKESLAYRGSLLCRIEGQRDALQRRLTAADERADVLEGLLRDASAWIKRNSCHGTDAIELWEQIDAELKPEEGAK